LSEQAVIVKFQYGLADLGPLREVEHKIDNAIREAGVGEYDGEEIAVNLSDGVLYMYGPDADRLFAVVRGILESAQFLRGAVVTVRYGPPKAPQTTVTLGSPN
jgi:hypothetical protein